MTQGSIKSFSTQQVFVPENSFISIRTTGGDKVICYSALADSTFPDSVEIISEFSNEERSFKALKDSIFTLVANADPVYYQVKTSSPSAVDLVPESLNTAHELIEDFDFFTENEWRIVKTNIIAEASLLNEDGGVLNLTNSSSEYDELTIQKIGAGFQPVAGKKFFYETKIKIGNFVDTAVIAGLCAPDTSLSAAVIGAYFLKLQDSTEMRFVFNNGITEVLTSVGFIDGNWVILGFKWDGFSANADLLINNIVVSSIKLTDLIMNIALTPIFSIVNGTGGSGSLSVDYYQTIKGR
jgi:hypothetical protein